MRNEITGRGSRQRLSLVTAGETGRVTSISPQLPGDSPEAEICEVRSSADREALQRFRHRITVLDMNRPRFELGYQTSVRDDNLKTGSVQLIASSQSEIVGTVQINYAFARDLGIDADFYRMREFAGADHPDHTCVISRLLVAPAWRGGALGRELCLAAYRHALGQNARTAFLRCNDPLVYYFSALGFKPYIGKARHAQCGEVVPMMLELQDEKYLAAVKSPFVAALRSWKRARAPEVRVVPKSR